MCHSSDEIQEIGLLGKRKWTNERNHIHTPCFFLRQVTCNLHSVYYHNIYRHTIILLEGTALILKHINRIMYRIIQGKRSHCTWQCSIHLHILKCTGTLLKRRIFLEPFHMKLQWLNCVWKFRLRKIKISFIWICAVKQGCKFCLSIFWKTFFISYPSRFFPLVYENLCPV